MKNDNEGAEPWRGGERMSKLAKLCVELHTGGWNGA